MAKSMRKMLLLAKEEVTPGTDAAPTAAANAILARGLMPQIINAEFVSRNLLRTYKGNSQQLAAGVHRVLECEVELAGAGAAGTAPKWGPLLKACGFAQTLTALTDAQYTPVSEGEPTLTLYGYLDGILFKLTGAIGTVAFEMNAKAIPVMKFKFMGEYSEPTDTALPAGADYTGFLQPKVVGKVNTPTFTFHGIACAASAFAFDVANQHVYRDLIGASGPHSPDRQPSGSATLELQSVATKNWGATVKDGTEGAVQIVHGLTAGNIIQVDMPKVQLTSAPTLQDQDKVAMLGISFSINPNAGNDEIKITVK